MRNLRLTDEEPDCLGDPVWKWWVGMGARPSSLLESECLLIPVVWVDISAWVQTPALHMPAVGPAQVPYPTLPQSPHICTTETAPVAQVGLELRPQDAWVAKLTAAPCPGSGWAEAEPCLDAAGDHVSRSCQDGLSPPVLIHTHAISVCYPAWLASQKLGLCTSFFL